MTSTRRYPALCVLMAMLLTVLLACGHDDRGSTAGSSEPSPRNVQPTFAGAPELPPPDLTDDGPGSLVTVEPAPSAVFDNLQATGSKVVFRSTSASGEPTEVSALLAVPPGDAPKGGWPIVSFGHDLTGTTEKCAPSVADRYGGYDGAIAGLVQQGYVVVLPDYQGLGRPGLPHSILEAVALGNNLTDAARAARRVLPSASPQWAAYGLGEGGLAAWSAAERAGVYGRGMNMLGAVAIAPYADLSPRADPARIKDMSTPEQFRLQIQMLQSLSTMESDFDIDAHRSAAVRAAWGLLVDCAPTDRAGAERARNALASADFAPRDAAATEDLRRRLERLALPVGEPAPGAAPVLVVFATADPLVPAEGVQGAIKRACARGETIEVYTQVGVTSAANDMAVDFAQGWMQGQFDGQHPIDVCVGAR